MDNIHTIQRFHRSDENYNELKTVGSSYVLTKIRDAVPVSTTELEIGRIYRIVPENPQKLKHRNRICTIIEFDIDRLKVPTRAKVRFTDNNRVGMIYLEDLIPLES